MKNIITRAIKGILKITKYAVNKNRFGKITLTTFIDSPLRIIGPQNIFLDEKVSIHYKGWLQAVPLTGNRPQLIIKKGATIGDFAHIIATKNITIEEDVLVANFVYISDNIHSFNDIDIPIIKQTIIQKSPVYIGSGSWIGEHCCIIGASIGKHCVIGANSVVTKDIPDYCIAAGVPAKIIKRYDFELKEWRRTNPDGSFI